MVDELIGTSRGGKPRENGITITSDYFEPIDNGLLEQAADYIDLVRIGTSIPLVVERSKLQERIRRYHELGIKVISGGAMIEVAAEKDVVSEMLVRLSGVGFDVVEVSELARDIRIEKKQEILRQIAGLSMEYVFAVGNGTRPKASEGKTIARIQEAFELKSQKVILEVPREGAGKGASDALGEIDWDTLNGILGSFGPPNLIFETSLASQQTALILELGPAVNLAGVRTDRVLALETQRLGLTAETLGLSRPLQAVEGSPASKFVYHLIRTEHPIDQTTLILRSGLPRRTVQAALSFLVGNNMVREVLDSSDARKHRYTMK